MHRIALRPVTESDLGVFYHFQADQVSAAMAGFTSRDRDADLVHWHQIIADESVRTFAVTYDDVVVGNIVSWGDGTERDLGYWIDAPYFGRGIATEAVRLFLNIELIRPLFAHVMKTNLGSQRVLTKHGFVPHGEDDEEFVLILAGPGPLQSRAPH
jgi:RimJ/RimL family protein N-acetyltransferase